MHSMNKAFLSLLLFAATTAFSAAELTTVDEPEKEINAPLAATFKSSGTAASFKSSKRIFLRDGVKVAELITSTQAIGDKPPTVAKFVLFHIDANNWLEINLDDPRRFNSHFAGEVSVEASDDSITVTAPKTHYCEIFFKSNGTFLDGASRERIAGSFLNAEVIHPQ